MPNLDLLGKRLLVVSGKGGVGKTVISSALALLGARAGKSVLLVKIDDQGRTAQLFGTPPLGDEIRFVPGHGPMSTFGDERRTNPYVSDEALGAGRSREPATGD